jgi:hypothetical protein
MAPHQDPCQARRKIPSTAGMTVKRKVRSNAPAFHGDGICAQVAITGPNLGVIRDAGQNGEDLTGYGRNSLCARRVRRCNDHTDLRTGNQGSALIRCGTRRLRVRTAQQWRMHGRTAFR